MRKTLIALAAATLAACSTELEVNAPYEENTVVYSLLNMRDTIHFVKINKAFLGEGNALDYAMIPDSNEYRDEDISKAMVYRVANGVRVDSFPLRDTLVDVRESGIFYHPQQKLYYFQENNVYLLPQSVVPVYLQQENDYELDLVVRGRQVRATAPIVNDFSISPVLQSPQTDINLIAANGGFGSYEVRWNSSRDGKRYEVSYRFNYSEVRGTDTLHKAITTRVGNRVTANSQNSEALSLLIDGGLFFGGIANAVPSDPSVDKRIFTGLDILFYVANDDFHTFLTLSEPVSGIIEERPAFSNVDNAFGVFASRYNKSVLGKRLSDASLNYLINSSELANRRFCSAFNVGPPYGCN